MTSMEDDPKEDGLTSWNWAKLFNIWMDEKYAQIKETNSVSAGKLTWSWAWNSLFPACFIYKKQFMSWNGS